MARAGRFKDRIALHKKRAGLDAAGNTVTGFDEALGSVSADVLETLGRERLASGRTEGNATATVRVRASALTRQITVADRIALRGGLWLVIADPIEVGQKGTLLEFLVERGGAS